MPMNARLLRPRATAALVAVDADARTYINAVRTADGGQYMEAGVQRAIDDFIVGCKADGIWSAIKASCILMGARTLSGALTPLVGTGPTNNGPFVSGDYNRKTGMVGNGTSKYLDTNYTLALQNSRSISVYASTVQTSGLVAYIGSRDQLSNARSQIIAAAATPNQITTRLGDTTSDTSVTSNNVAGFIGISRSGSASYTRRANATSQTVSVASTSATETSLWVFARPLTGSEGFTSARLAFYHAGESIDLALLDSRVSTLYTAIGNAIP